MKTEHQFTAAVERNLRGVFFFSSGACKGCDDCGLASPCEHCDGYGTNESEVKCIKCIKCNGTGTHEPTEHEIEMASESEFSWSSCDSCGSTLGGDRHPSHGIIAETMEKAQAPESEITHFNICTDCVMYHANGDLPEDWRAHS